MRHNTELKRILKEEGRTQTWLASKIGVHYTTVSGWATGKHIPQSHLMQKASEALRRPMQDIFFTKNVDSKDED